MQILKDVVLGPLTTLKIGGPARYLASVDNIAELTEAITFATNKSLPVYILGGGSNVLFSDAGYDGLVIRPRMRGIGVIGEDADTVSVRVGAGELLDDVIAWSVDKEWWGIENMSYVPGTIGGAIIQNAGCYGQEIAEVIESVEVYDTKQDELDILSKQACGFTYRHSIFNTTQKGRYVILAINLFLRKTGTPNLAYKDLINYFADKQLRGQTPQLLEVREAIIKIRKSKGQDWVALPSAGSFFSNFQLDEKEFENLCSKIEREFSKEKCIELRELVDKIKTPSDIATGKIKVPSAWVMGQLLGLKGYVFNERVRVSPYHALNLINTGGAKTKDMLDLFNYLKGVVKDKTGLELVNEPEFVGF